MNDHPNTLHLGRHPRNRAIPENVQFHVSIDGYPVRVYVATRSLSLSFITVCTGVRFMRKLNDEKVVFSEKGRSCPLHKRRTKEGHAVGRRREENHEDDITLHASHAFAVFRRQQRLARRLSLQSLIGYPA